MDIAYVSLILIVLIIFSVGFAENHADYSKLLLSIIVLVGIWISISLSFKIKKEKFIRAVPVLIENKVAFSIFENTIINCTNDFKTQFKPGDSIYVFQEQNTWSLGIKYSGEDYDYRLKK